jgi:hypothetical protein
VKTKFKDMTNRDVKEKCIIASLLSYSSQVGLLTALQLRKNQSQIAEKIIADENEIKKISEERDSQEDAEVVMKAFLDKEFEGTFFTVNINDIGNIKGEIISLQNGGQVDAKWAAENLIGSIIIVPE